MAAKSNFHEKRKDIRVDRSVPIKISVNGSQLLTETGNISRSGAYCKVSSYIEPMTKMKINFHLPVEKNGKQVNKKIACEGVVVRTEELVTDEHYNIAIFFNDIRPSDADIIAEYISSYLEE